MRLEQLIDPSWIYGLLRLGYGLHSGKPLEDVYREILHHVMQGFGGEYGTLAVVDENVTLFNEGEKLAVVAAIEIPRRAASEDVFLSQAMLAKAAGHGEGMLLNGDIRDDARFGDAAPGGAPRPLSVMCWALRSEERLVGAIGIGRTEALPPFTDTHLAEGVVVMGLLATVIESIHLHRKSQQSIAMLSDTNRELARANRQLGDMQNMLLQTEKMSSIGQLAAGVAHEINNPIGFVYSNLGSLEKYVQDVFGMLDQYEQAEGAIADGEVRDRLRAARKKLDIDFLREDLGALMSESKDGITRVKQIVQNLKDFSHADASDEWHHADLHKGLDSTLNIVHNEIKYKANVVKQYGDLPEVECLPSQLNQVFMNLLVNAAHAIEERGTITLRTGRQGEEVWVDVADTGKGIPPENMKKIFDPFFTTKPVGKGTGLGLSLSYGIIGKHHGRIEVQSEIGKGTTFRVWLPVRHIEDSHAEPRGVTLLPPGTWEVSI